MGIHLNVFSAPNVATPKPAAPAARLPFDVEKAKDQVETLLSNVATENFQETLETIKEYFTTHDVKDDDKAVRICVYLTKRTMICASANSAAQ